MENDPNRVSNAILTISSETIGPIMNLKLHKLLYYSQAWHLALYEKPLFDEDFEAWANGPILPSQYQRFKHFSGEPIFGKIIKGPKTLFDHIKDVLRAYGDLSSFDLSQLSHSELPWLEARRGLTPYEFTKKIISKKSMTRFFRTKMQNKEQGETMMKSVKNLTTHHQET